MKAKILIGPERSGKTKFALLISKLIKMKERNFSIIKGDDLNSVFVFSNIPDDIDLLIIDDLPLNYNFDKHIQYKRNNENITFEIVKRVRGKEDKIIKFPFLIFTTNKLNKKSLQFIEPNKEIFDIITFPLFDIEEL